MFGGRCLIIEVVGLDRQKVTAVAFNSCTHFARLIKHGPLGNKQ